MSDWLSSALGFGTSTEEVKKAAPSANGTATPVVRKASSGKAGPAGSATKTKAAGASGATAAKKAAAGQAGKAGTKGGGKPANGAAANGTPKGGEGTKEAAANGSGTGTAATNGTVSAASSKKGTGSLKGDAAGETKAEKGSVVQTESSAGEAASSAKQEKTAAAPKTEKEKKASTKEKAKEGTAEAAEKKASGDNKEAEPAKSTAAPSVSQTKDVDSLEKKQAAAAAAAAAAGTDTSKRPAPAASSSSATSVAKAGALRRIRVTEALPELISQAQACVYEPAEYFVAWQGVLTIIYSGIPPSLCKLKARMSERFPGLTPENPGSLWPKTSLACLKDDKRLSPEQLAQLRDICSKMNFQLVYSPPIHVNSVSLVLYENCCLEKQLLSTHIQLQQPEDLSPVSEEQKAHVRKVADEFSARNIQNYWYHVSKDGNRSKHYKQNKAGATLVHFLGDELPPSVATFQKLVEAAMPGMYDWFPTESLHITLRAVC